MTVGLSSYLTVAAILFTIGVVGIFLNRKNIIIILMSVELILLAVNINFVAFSAYLGDLVGQVFALFVLLGAEFLAMILVVVYVGAVAVLFLFVVMMLDIDFAELKRGTLQYLPFGALIGLVLVAELVMAGSVWTLKPAAKTALASATPAGLTNTAVLGRILYTDYVYYFQIAGLVLLVAMIGAIVLTLRSRPGVRRQNISVQNARTAAMAVTMHDLKPGEGA